MRIPLIFAALSLSLPLFCRAELTPPKSSEGPKEAPKPSAEPRGCVARVKDRWIEPKDLDSLLDCQFKLRMDFIKKSKTDRGTPPTADELESFNDLQRAEVRDYLSRHPERAQTAPAGDDEEGDDASTGSRKPRQGGRAAASDRRQGMGQGRCRPRMRDSDWDTAGGGKFQAQWDSTTGAMDGNMQGLDAGTQGDLRSLGNEVMRESDQGRKGITPKAARSIADFLICQQGGMSQDMTNLLHGVAQDGAKLSPSTMLQLKKASREAKSHGLSLGIPGSMENWLLDPKTDPQTDIRRLLSD